MKKAKKYINSSRKDEIYSDDLLKFNDTDFAVESIARDKSEKNNFENGYLKAINQMKTNNFENGYLKAYSQKNFESKRKESDYAKKIELDSSEGNDLEDGYLKAFGDVQERNIEREITAKDQDIETNFSGEESITLKAEVVSSKPGNIPVVKGTVISSHGSAEDEKVIKDRSLRIAIDFVKHEKIIWVDELKYIYNGKFYAVLKERELQNRIFGDI